MWGFRASDIYQGGETEPLQADRDVPAAFKSLDNESQKNYPHVVALNVRASSQIANSPMTVLFISLVAFFGSKFSGSKGPLHSMNSS